MKMIILPSIFMANAADKGRWVVEDTCMRHHRVAEGG